jgi:oxygen-independent coproporphyrinogen-3 oxidase
MIDDRPAWLWPRAAYVHVPFCAHHCGYCDFAVAVGQDERIDAYLDALENELSRLKEPQRVDTLFFGGGTPTYLAHRPLERLLRLVQRWLPLADNHEFSAEANPSFLDEEKIRLLRAFGVNRLSLGVQSFQPRLLQILERDHRPDDVPRVLEFIRPQIANISVDLIFGVPEQTLEQWHDDLQRALALQPAHVATYGLTYEKGTRLWRQREQGQVAALDEETEYQYYTHAIDVLEGAGFEHYEISNFARSGYRCRHNQVYWANHAYFGFGVGAARYIHGVRELNTRAIRTYMERLQAGKSPTFQSECLSPRERAIETIALQLRRAAGINRHDFQRQTGMALDDLVGPKIQDLVAQDLGRDDGAAVALTRKGKCLADAVIEALMRFAQIP